MILTKEDLRLTLISDSLNYKGVIGVRKWTHQFFSTPISDQWYIWKYIICLRKCEYHLNNKGVGHKLLVGWYAYKIRKYSRITGFQIPPNVVESGLTIWHWGPIIINPEVRIGKNCILNPMVIIGHKTPGQGTPQIGNNVFIGGGAKIIGNISIGDNVIIAPNTVVVKDVPSNVVIGGIPSKVLKCNN